MSNVQKSSPVIQKMAKQWRKIARLQRIVGYISQEELEVRFQNAVEKCDAQLIQECLERGISPNFHRGDGYTALHMASENGNVKLVTVLLQYSETNIDAQTHDGATPLLLACLFGRFNSVEVLVKKGANPNIPNTTGCTPLHSACLGSYEDIVGILLKFRANPNVANEFAKTPLTFAAVERPNLRIVEMLIRRGTKFSFYEVGGLPAFLDCALNCTDLIHLQVIKKMVELGANINQKDPYRERTALHISAITGYEPLTEYLLKNGADKTLKDRKGETAEVKANLFKNYHIAEMIAEYSPAPAGCCESSSNV